MDNFVDEGENIPLVQQDYDDYDDCKTPDTSRVGETSFMEGPDVSEATPTSTFRLRQKVKLNKLTGLYKHLDVKVIQNMLI